MDTMYENEQGAGVTTLTSPMEVMELLRLIEKIAGEQGWQPGDQLRAYIGHSVYFALRIKGVLAGGLQLVLDDGSGTLPCRTSWPELDLAGRTDVADVALLALTRECRGRSELFWLLCTELWRYCIFNRISELWFEVPPPVLRLYRRVGWPLEVKGPLREHWGEPTYPCSMPVSDLTAAFIHRAQSSETYRAIALHALREPLPQEARGLPALLAA